MRARLAIGALAGALLALGAPAAAGAAQPPGSPNLHDARYCEILELRGTIPDARVTVWNTIGLNDCPAAKWNAFDAGALAAELGDTALILNGPRYFLIDSATARIGRVRSFHGLEMRKVATIPIRTAADLTRAPYAEHTVNRDNAWSWNRGRRVYELLAPDGFNYVMQSYAQIVDPQQTRASLRTLGERLQLPQGWSYRTRRLKRALTLNADGKATIIQDDLQNTYQRLPHRGGQPKRHRVQVSGATRTTGSPAPGTLEDQGTTSGPPFGPGTVDLIVALGGSTADATFEIDSPRGSAFGTAAMQYVISGSEITFTGTATFDGGTGRFRGIRGTVDACDHNTLDGQSGTLTLDGFVRY